MKDGNVRGRCEGRGSFSAATAQLCPRGPPCLCRGLCGACALFCSCCLSPPAPPPPCPSSSPAAPPGSPCPCGCCDSSFHYDQPFSFLLKTKVNIYLYSFSIGGRISQLQQTFFRKGEMLIKGFEMHAFIYINLFCSI